MLKSAASGPDRVHADGCQTLPAGGSDAAQVATRSALFSEKSTAAGHDSVGATFVSLTDRDAVSLLEPSLTRTVTS